MDIIELIKRSCQRWWWYAIGLIISGAIGAAYYLMTPPVYEVTGTMMIRAYNQDVRSTQNELLQLRGEGEDKLTQDEVQVLLSRDLMGLVVDELNLQQVILHKRGLKWAAIAPDPTLGATLQTDSMGIIHPMQVDVRKQGNDCRITIKYAKQTTHLRSIPIDKLAQGLTTPLGQLCIRIPQDTIRPNHRYRFLFLPRTVAIERQLAALHVSRMGKESNMIRLTMAGTSPALNKAIVNALMQAYNRAATIDKNELAEGTARIIASRLTSIAIELDEAEQAIQAYKREHQISNLDRSADYYKSMDEEYVRHQREITLEREVLDFLDEFIREPRNQHSLIPANLGISDGTLLSLVGDYNREVLALNRIMQTAGEDNPVALSKREQIALLHESILLSITNVREGLNLREKNNRAARQENSYSLNQLPEQQREYQELCRKRDAIEERYIFLQQKKEENYLIMNAQSIPARIVDGAETSVDPVSPNLKRIAVLVLIFGMGIPVFLVYSLKCKV